MPNLVAVSNPPPSRYPRPFMSQPSYLMSQAGADNILRAQGQLPFNAMPPAQPTSTSASANHRPLAVARPFTAPAHKHAHHLHSIPPREKSTRTLIIDHMLWVHGRTRFAQARAELGMTDRTGGPSSFNYTHRFRPENFEEEEEVLSDGEDVAKLKIRQDVISENHVGIHEEGAKRRDISLAQSLNIRAESLEKVVTAMLDQPPAIEPHHGDESPTASTPPRPRRHLHTLPNGVRLRLALGTVINDLFARHSQAFVTHNTNPNVTIQYSQDISLTSNISERFLPSAYSALPPVLMPLVNISVSMQALMANSDRNAYVRPPASVDAVSHTNLLIRLVSNISPHVRALYTAGAKHSFSSSSIHSKCFRHLRAACDICTETDGKTPKTGARKGRSDPSSTGSGRDATIRGGPIALDSMGITGWRDGSGIGSGLSKPVPGGTVLRRAPSHHDAAFGSTLSSDFIQRFLRLSALVAMELGNETGLADEDGVDSAADEMSIREYEPTDKQSQNRLYDDALRPSTEWYMLLAGLLTRAVLDGYLIAGWKGLDAVECLLSCGLFASYSKGIGEEQGDVRPSENQKTGGDPAERFGDFDPDELPSLQDAATILFPSARSGFSQRRDGPEAEYEAEMFERLRIFLDVPPNTMDLRAHLEGLAQLYPVEPVERAAVRFCEALAKWRGKPELETYKKMATSLQAVDAEILRTPNMGMESFVNSTPNSPVASNIISIDRPSIVDIHRRKPSIEKYFIQAHTQALRDSGRKRPRSPNIGRSGKRLTR